MLPSLVPRIMGIRQSKILLWLLFGTSLMCLVYFIKINTITNSRLPEFSNNYVNILPTIVDDNSLFERESFKRNAIDAVMDSFPSHRQNDTDQEPFRGPQSTTPTTAEPSLAPGDSHLPYMPENVVVTLRNLGLKEYQIVMTKIETEAISFPKDPPLKKILFWNEAYEKKHFGFGFGREPFLLAGCRVNTCFTTGDRNRFPLEEIDALMWHFRSSDKSLPEKRSPHTRYIFWNIESASYLDGNIEDFDDLFNWTMTYKLNSDFPIPYDRVYRRRIPLEIPKDVNHAKNKTKMAAWLVSHCETVGVREEFVQKIRKWIKVDIFGGCGDYKCDTKDLANCEKMISESYKFYFAFENSLCEDYITEKFYGRIWSEVVPVVYGLGNYSRDAPPHSFINALDFPSPKALADYLIYLDQNDTAYNEYFLWKPYHHNVGGWYKYANFYCDICERLHTDNTTKTYNLTNWFVDDSHCLTKTSPRISRLINGE